MLSPHRIKDLFGHPPPADPADDMMDMDMVRSAMDIIGKFTFWHRPEFYGLENIPRQGGALMVGNHGLMGADAPFVWHGVYEATGRVVRGLGAATLFYTPLLKWALHRLGALHGTPENGLRFLRAGHLLNVYPGGAREAMKTPDNRYRLLWATARGFVRLAMRAEVPVVLHMCVGSDETYRSLTRMQWPGRVVGNPKYEMPLLLGLGVFPLPVKLRYYFSEPIPLPGDPDDPDVVEAHHAMLHARGEEMLSQGVERRRSVYFG